MVTVAAAKIFDGEVERRLRNAVKGASDVRTAIREAFPDCVIDEIHEQGPLHYKVIFRPYPAGHHFGVICER